MGLNDARNCLWSQGSEVPEDVLKEHFGDLPSCCPAWQTCLASGGPASSLMEPWGQQDFFFSLPYPSSSLLLGTNAQHIHMRRGSPSTQQPELFPEAPPPGWPAPVPLVSTCFSQSCPGPSSHIKGHTQLRSKERYWGLVLLMSDLEPAVASLTETCFLIFVFTLNSHFPAHYDW